MKKNWLNRMRSGLSKSRTNLAYQLKSAFSGDKITDDTWEEVEAALLGADVGVEATTDIVKELQSACRERMIIDPTGVRELLETLMVDQLVDGENSELVPRAGEKAILLMVGVNGTGKTTTTGKLAMLLRQQGVKVALVAADTFRAAAIEQLQEWAGRAQVDIIRQQRGSDPAAVVYDAMAVMRAREIEVMLVDTAGRLHTYANLMEELKKVKRVAVREAGSVPVRTIMVVDGTTGQNGIAQASMFHEAIGLDATIVTKLDGTAKGGIVLAIKRQLGIPVVMVGMGEGIDDLKLFDPREYVSALLDEE